MMKTIDDVAVAGRRVLVRADLNVPLDGDRVTDDSRITASLPTLASLAERGAKVIICAHLGRPKGQPDLKYSLAPVAVRLGELLGRRVELAADTVGSSAHAAITALRPGELVMCENLRFNRAETSHDDLERGAFADELATLADLYVSDGFGALHRKHASVYDVALRLPSVAGYLVQAEVAALSRLTGDIARPYLLVLGGAELARAYLDKAARGGAEIVLPSDVVVAADRTAAAAHEVVAVHAIPPDQMALDIGPESAAAFAARIQAAKTVFWNGPMGVFELDQFAGGTTAVARALTGGDAFTVIGGGDTDAAVHALGFPGTGFGYVSTGGGASLEFIQGHPLPGLTVLEEPRGWAEP